MSLPPLAAGAGSDDSRSLYLIEVGEWGLRCDETAKTELDARLQLAEAGACLQIRADPMPYNQHQRHPCFFPEALDAGLQSPLVNIHKLALQGLNLESMEQLPIALPNLQELWVEQCLLKDKKIPGVLGQLTSLHRIYFKNAEPSLGVRTKLLHVLGRLPHLTALDFTGQAPVLPATIKNGAFPQLRSLALSFREKLDVIPQFVAGMPRLEKLQQGPPMTIFTALVSRNNPRIMRDLLQGCPTLTNISLPMYSANDRAIEVLLQLGTQITSIHMDSMVPSTDRSSHPCTWQHLSLRHPSIECAAFLPLHSLTTPCSNFEFALDLNAPQAQDRLLPLLGAAVGNLSTHWSKVSKSGGQKLSLQFIAHDWAGGRGAAPLLQLLSSLQPLAPWLTHMKLEWQPCNQMELGEVPSAAFIRERPTLDSQQLASFGQVMGGERLTKFDLEGFGAGDGFWGALLLAMPALKRLRWEVGEEFAMSDSAATALFSSAREPVTVRLYAGHPQSYEALHGRPMPQDGRGLVKIEVSGINSRQWEEEEEQEEGAGRGGRMVRPPFRDEEGGL